MVTLVLTATALAMTAVAELLHARRVRRLARLAFGPSGSPAVWARLVPLSRVAAAGALTWALATLMDLPPRVHSSDALKEDEYRRLLIVLDVSPSMRLLDSGPTGDQSRLRRARDLLDSLFQRVSIAHYKTSVVAVYNGAKPVVVDTVDAEVIRNILGDLPMQFAFQAGKTKLLDGIEEAAKLAKPWPPRSTLLLLVSDGDTVPPTGMPALPASIRNVLVIGVGDPLAGRFIDGRQSRQDASTLRQIATRLGGVFYNGNASHLPSDTIAQLSEGTEKSVLEKLTLREYALFTIAVASAWLALLPLLLHALGTRWQAGVPLNRPQPQSRAS
ncbi:MAG: vWA domain-containing protein [Planctomycetota bacterium]